MSEQLTTPTITKEVVSGKMALALTRAELNIQTLHDIGAGLTLNEDNIPAIAEFLSKGRKAKKVVDDEHKLIKEPFLKQGQVIDESKREMLKNIDDLLSPIALKHTELCQAVEKRAQEAERERQRKANILQGIETNMISFSQKIAECTTNEQLISIERLINLEKGAKAKYQEFLPTAVDKFESLTSLLKLQKDNVKESIRLEDERKKAEEKGDDAKIMELQERQEVLTARIDEAKINVQETAINHSSVTVEDAVEVMPEVVVRRKSWDFEVVDIQAVVKKMPSWTKIELIDDKVKEFLKASKDSWNDEGGEERIINGVRFYIKKTY